jgi:hypothetical protein
VECCRMTPARWQRRALRPPSPCPWKESQSRKRRLGVSSFVD